LEQVRSYVGNGLKDLVSKAIPGKDEKFKQKAICSFKSYYEKRMLDITVMFSGVKEMLESLKDKKSYSYFILRILSQIYIVYTINQYE
jgi:phosphoglycolate phosphatase-like HAD superfamily hydrolase